MDTMKGGASKRSAAKVKTTSRRTSSVSSRSSSTSSRSSLTSITTRAVSSASGVSGASTASFSRMTAGTSSRAKTSQSAVATRRSFSSTSAVSEPVFKTSSAAFVQDAAPAVARPQRYRSPAAAAVVAPQVVPTRSMSVVAPAAAEFKVTAAPVRVMTKRVMVPPQAISMKQSTAAAAFVPAMVASLRKFSTERKAGYITLNFNTPAGPVLPKGPVHMFEVSTIEGDMGVIADHSPFIGELRPGVIKIFTEPGADAKKWFVPGGFMLIKNDSQADITASEAIPVEELDADVAKKTLEQANLQLSQATDELAKAEATITIDVCTAIIKAADSV